MPLVKNGKIATDTFVHVADDARTAGRRRDPGLGGALSRRSGSAVAPRRQDRRDLAEQPRRRRPRAVSRPARRGGAGVSDVSATAAPTARRGCCASAMAISGELRATGQVLRDQFVFMLRAGFDAFEVKKEADAEAFANTAKRYSVFYQPTGDGRLTALHRRMQLRHSESAGQ